MNLPAVLSDGRGTGSGFNLYLETEKKIATFLKTFEEDHMTWLEEILLEARKTFSRRSLTLLPKTPSNAKRNRRIRPNSDDTEESSSGSPPAKKRAQRKSHDPIDETEVIQCSVPKRATRSTRASTRRTTQDKNKRTTRNKQTKSVFIMEASEESSTEKESLVNTEQNLSEKDNRVKRLINHHEKMITESSDDDFHSPKRLCKLTNKELDTVPEATSQPMEKQNVVKEPAPIALKSITEEAVVNVVQSNAVSCSKKSSAVSPVKNELVASEGLVKAILVTVSDDSITSKTDEDEPGDKEESTITTDSKVSSNSELELSENDVVVEETKEEVSMEEDSLNEGSGTSAPMQTSFMLNNVRMSISMSKSKKRSSLSKRRLSRDTGSRRSLRASKRLSIITKKLKMESCEESSQEEIESSNANVRKSVRQSLRVSKRLSATSQKSSSEDKSQEGSDSSNADSKIVAASKPVQMTKKLKMESCEESSQEEIESSIADERPKTRSSLSKHQLSVETNVRQSVRQSLRVSKRLSATSQKSSSEDKSQEGSDSNADEKIAAPSKPVQMVVETEGSPVDQETVKSTTESEESSAESSVEFKSATEATPEPKKQTRSRTKQRKPAQKAVQPVINEPAADTTSDDVSEKASPKQKNTRTRTKMRKNKKSSENAVSVQLTTEKRSIDEPVGRKKSGTKKKRSSKADDEVQQAKKGKKIRLSHPDKVEVINLDVEVTRSTRSQSAASEHFDDSLETSSSDEVKLQDVEIVAEPKRKSRRRTQDDEPDAVSLTTGNKRSPEQKRSQDTTASSEESCEEELIGRTPSPKCPAEKVIRPHPQSFLNKKKDEGTLQTNSKGIISSFIKRNTPKKKTCKERQEEIKAQMKEKEKKEKELKNKRLQERKNKLEEQKRKREERARRAAEVRERKILEHNEKRQRLEEFYENKQALTDKQKEERKREDMQKKKISEKKRLEAEERRRIEDDNRKQKLKQQEEEEKRYKEMMSRKKEFEEQERLQKQEEWRLQQELRKADQEKQRLEESKRRRELEIESEREQQRIKEHREKERREFERMRIQESEMREREKKGREEAEELKKIEAERIRREQERKKEREHLKQMMMKEKQQQLEEMPKPKIPLSTNTTALNTTVTKEPDMKSPQSYDITPQRIHKPSTEENYCIDDINSDDSTDDEEHPRKTIPSWAQGAALRAHLIHQIRFPVNLDQIFGAIDPPDLTLVFQKKRARYLKRTSSAVWNSPIFKL